MSAEVIVMINENAQQSIENSKKILEFFVNTQLIADKDEVAILISPFFAHVISDIYTCLYELGKKTSDDDKFNISGIMIYKLIRESFANLFQVMEDIEYANSNAQRTPEDYH